MAETGYQNGLVTNLEYLDTQLALTQSRVSYLSSLANHRIAGARLRQAMGIAEQE
jgi:outer membrane protein TolC